jgi:hypothetical protein
MAKVIDEYRVAGYPKWWIGDQKRAHNDTFSNGIFKAIEWKKTISSMGKGVTKNFCNAWNSFFWQRTNWGVPPSETRHWKEADDGKWKKTTVISLSVEQKTFPWSKKD